MADVVDRSTDALQDVETLTAPMYERVILAFLARRTQFRNGDEELLRRLEDLQSRKIGEAILHPTRALSDPIVGRMAERFFLDAGNREAAELIREQILEAEAREARTRDTDILSTVHSAQLAQQA